MDHDDSFPIFRKLKTPRKSGRDVAFDLIEAKTGARPTDAAFRMWRSVYQRLPAKFALILLFEAVQRKISVKDSDFDSTWGHGNG